MSRNLKLTFGDDHNGACPDRTRHRRQKGHHSPEGGRDRGTELVLRRDILVIDEALQELITRRSEKLHCGFQASFLTSGIAPMSV